MNEYIDHSGWILKLHAAETALRVCQDQALDTLKPSISSPIIIDINCVNTLVYRTPFVDCPTSYSSNNYYITLGNSRHPFLLKSHD